jgi:hypothetical protein
MSHLRALSAMLVSAATTFSLVTASGCGTGAVGISDCRDIQRARCRAGVACGMIADEQACERYYRDFCLHGLAAKPPADASVAACVEVIDAAGRCAATDPEIQLSDCNESVKATGADLRFACDVVKHPERSVECSFLTDVPVQPGSAGQSSGGQSGDGDGDGDTDAGSGGAAATSSGGAAAE